MKRPCSAVWMRSHCVLIRTQLFSRCLCKRKLSSWKETICSRLESAGLGQIAIIPPLSFCLLHFVSFFETIIPLLLLLQLLHILCILILFLSLHHLCFVLFQPALAYSHLWPSYREILPGGNNFLFVPWATDTISCWLTSSFSLKFCAVDTNWYWYRCKCHYSGVECYFWGSISNGIL